MSSNEIAISIRNLTKRYEIYHNPGDRLKQFIFSKLNKFIGRKSKNYYREFWALNNVSFEIRKGETIGIIGRNGSGKSTLLQIICGTLTPSSGDVSVNGRVAALLELGSGFNPEFTGRENIFLNAAILGLTREEIELRFNQIVDFADIGDFIEQPVKTYSSGMMVRLAFAVIAHVDADILIIDEALSVGDVFFTQKCMRFLRQFMAKGTVLFVSHDTGAVVNFCTNAILLDGGIISNEGSPKRICEIYLEKLYEKFQDINSAKENYEKLEEVLDHEEYFDLREPLINNSNLRNDIELFKFNPKKSSDFGDNAAEIISVCILDMTGKRLSHVIGGTEINLRIACKTNKIIHSPILGFQLKDHLGQIIFADNTYLQYKDVNLVAEPGCRIEAEFRFKLPILPSGDYSISPAIGSGTQSDHIQHHWIHDALQLRVNASSVCFGLIGVPMKNINLKVIS